MDLLDLAPLMSLWLLYSETGSKEYCFPNNFNASCGEDSIILMTSARYGRMTAGRCLTSDYHVGCWADVLYHVDRKCSGRTQCVVMIPDTTLHQLQPCPKDLLAYLEADFICQRVRSSSQKPVCRNNGDLIPAPSSPGYLASILTELHGLGSPRCPWVITAATGQRINVTLFDFGVSRRFDDVNSMCHVYAKISETGRSASETAVCGGRVRERSVYVSESNRLEISIMSSKLNEDPIHFLLKYEALGCTDPLVPGSAWMRRNGEKAVISCNNTSQIWHIVCQGNRWFGQVDNCTSDFAQLPRFGTLSVTTRSSQFPYGLPVAVITGLVVGVILGAAMLVLVITCLKQKKMPCDGARRACGRSAEGEMSEGRYPTDKSLSHPDATQYGYTHICGITSHYAAKSMLSGLSQFSSAPDITTCDIVEECEATLQLSEQQQQLQQYPHATRTCNRASIEKNTIECRVAPWQHEQHVAQNRQQQRKCNHGKVIETGVETVEWDNHRH